MNKNLINILALALLALLLTGCGTFSIEMTTPTPSPEAVIAPEDGQSPTKTQIPTVTQAVVETLEPAPVNPYWRVVEDYRTGVRFAVPCFWEVDIPNPQQDPTGLAYFAVRNYPLSFPQSFGDKGADLIWQNGAMKIDMGYIQPETFNLLPGATAGELVQAMYPANKPDFELVLLSSEMININGAAGLLVTTMNKNNEETSMFVLLPVTPQIFMSFSAYPGDAFNHPDVRGILNSLVIAAETGVAAPEFKPANPPGNLSAACLGGAEATAEAGKGGAELVCPAAESNSAADLACMIQDAVLSKNLSTLVNVTHSEFRIGLWGSEGRIVSPDELVRELHQVYLPENPSAITFYSGREVFPALDGLPVDSLFGASVSPALVVYSEGWGVLGEGAALLFITQDPGGNYVFRALMYAAQGFEG